MKIGREIKKKGKAEITESRNGGSKSEEEETQRAIRKWKGKGMGYTPLLPMKREKRLLRQVLAALFAFCCALRDRIGKKEEGNRRR